MPYALLTTTADGSTNEFTVTFPYISKSHVKIIVDGEQLAEDAYSWVSDTRVALVESAASLSGKVVIRKRVTPSSTPLVSFTPTNLSSTALNTLAASVLYILQEALDRLDGFVAGLYVVSVNGRDGAVTLAKSDVGLSNVDNTSDLNKPISTATQSALDAKAASSHTHSTSQVSGLDVTLAGIAGDIVVLDSAVSGKAPLSHTHATSEITGLDTSISNIESDISTLFADVADLQALPDTQDIGQFVMACDTVGAKTPGQTQTGDNLVWANATGAVSGTLVSGSVWRCCGYTTAANQPVLWRRIS